MTIRDYFPDVDDLVKVARAWPRVFAEKPSDTQPTALERGGLVVLCAGPEALGMVGENAEQIVLLLNRILDGDVLVRRIEAIGATRAELYLARDLLALKSWLVDYDIGI